MHCLGDRAVFTACVSVCTVQGILRTPLFFGRIGCHDPRVFFPGSAVLWYGGAQFGFPQCVSGGREDDSKFVCRAFELPVFVFVAVFPL